MDIPRSGSSPRARSCWSCTPAKCPTATTGASSVRSRPSKPSPSRDEIGVISYAWNGPGKAAASGISSSRRATDRRSPPSRRCSSATCRASTTRSTSRSTARTASAGSQERRAAEAHHRHLRRRPRDAQREPHRAVPEEQDLDLDRHRLHAHARPAQRRRWTTWPSSRRAARTGRSRATRTSSRRSSSRKRPSSAAA